MSDIEILRQELENHINHCNEWIAASDERFARGDEQFRQLIECTQKNTEALNDMVEETSALIKLYKDAQTVIKVGVTAQKVGVWIIKWPIIGAGILAIYNWFKAQGFFS